MNSSDKLANLEKGKGNQFFQKGKFSDALAHYSKAIELNPSEATYYSNRSECYFKLKEYNKAAQDGQKCIELNPSFTKGYFRAVQALKGLKKYTDAYKLVEKLFEMNQTEEAVSIGDGLIKSDTTNSPYGYFIRALTMYYNKGSSETTEIGNKLLKQALLLDPDFKSAIVFLKKVKNIESKKEEGNQLFKKGEFQKACESYTTALKVDPLNKQLNSAIYLNRGSCLIQLKKYDEAIDDLTKAIDINPQYSKAYSRRAQCYTLKENYIEAEKDLESILQLEPQNAQVRKQLQSVKKQAKLAKRKDYYKILGLENKKSDGEEIKKAYKKQARIWHPDRFSACGDEKKKKEAEEKFKEIGEAYSILSDDQKRAHYDSGADMEDFGNGGGFSGGFPGGMDINDLFMFMSQMGTGRSSARTRGGMGGNSFQFNFGGGGDDEDEDDDQSRGGGFHRFKRGGFPF